MIERMLRSRTLLISLAVAATATVAGVAVQQSVSADVSSGDRPVLIQITPCRLADSRPTAAVGPQVGKVGPGQTVVYDAFAATGECAGRIPADAVGLSTNVTALGATEISFLTFWPTGQRPNSSSLNPAPGEPPTPNAVATTIDSGKFNVYNNLGETHVLIDVNGYYVNHDHDDRYSTGSATAGTFSVGSPAFDAWSTNISWFKSFENGVDSGGAWITAMAYSTDTAPTPALAAPVQLPDGATVSSVTAFFEDTSPTSALAFQLRCEELSGGIKIVASGSSTASPASGEAALSITTSNAVVDNSECSYFFVAESGSWPSEADALKIRGVSITTT